MNKVVIALDASIIGSHFRVAPDNDGALLYKVWGNGRASPIKRFRHLADAVLWYRARDFKRFSLVIVWGSGIYSTELTNS